MNVNYNVTQDVTDILTNFSFKLNNNTLAKQALCNFDFYFYEALLSRGYLCSFYKLDTHSLVTSIVL